MKKDKNGGGFSDDEIKNFIEEHKKISIEPSAEVIEAANKVSDLIDALKALKNYKRYDKNLAKAEKALQKAYNAYERFGTDKRFEKYLAAELNRSTLVAEHKKTDIAEAEKKLKDFESFIDKKYWHDKYLSLIFFNLRLGLVNSLEEALKIADEKYRRKNK